MRDELPILSYILLCYINFTILLLNQIVTISLIGNHEYHIRSKDTINGDPPDLPLAPSNVDINLMQNLTNLEDEVISLKDIKIENLQNENKCLKTKVYVCEKEINNLEIKSNNIDQYKCGNNVEISIIPRSLNDK